MVMLCAAHTGEDGSLPKSALEGLSAALALSAETESPLTVGLVGAHTETAAQQIGGCGAVRFLSVEGPSFAQARYASDVAAAEALIRASGAQLVLAHASSRWARALPGAAVRVGGRVDTRISSLTVADGKPMAQRWFYRQRIVAEFTRRDRPWILLLEAGIAPAWQGSPAAVQIEKVDVPTDPAWDRTEVQGTEAASIGEQTIRPDADLLFVAGAGWTKKQADGQIHAAEAEELIKTFLQRTGASLGSSKSLVDQTGEGGHVLSLLTHLNQVGQTGSSPRHPKGLATCCHGEEPHVVGWRFITERRAVNLDPNCGWAQGKADVLYVADAFEVMRKLNELLASR